MGVLWFVAVGVIGAAIGWAAFERKYRRQLRQLVARRADLTKPDFVSMLANSAQGDVSEWVWEELRVYWQPGGAPHPDDDFLKDLPIDPDEPNDWLTRFCVAQGVDKASFPSWPYGEATTVRNLAAWLSDGRQAQLPA